MERFCDIVTVRQFNLYAELLTLLGHSESVPNPPAPLYAVTCRKQKGGPRAKLDTWFERLEIGEPLPSLPIWLSEIRSISFDLESSYEETCRVLRIR